MTDEKGKDIEREAYEKVSPLLLDLYQSLKPFLLRAYMMGRNDELKNCNEMLKRLRENKEV